MYMTLTSMTQIKIFETKNTASLWIQIHDFTVPLPHTVSPHLPQTLKMLMLINVNIQYTNFQSLFEVNNIYIF